MKKTQMKKKETALLKSLMKDDVAVYPFIVNPRDHLAVNI